jgi:para-nitrobenzyl esterase
MHPVVKTMAGEVRGRADDGVARFLGVPYAAAPFGPNRFRAPAPAPSWDGVRDALVPGPTAPKPGYPAPFDALLPEVDVAGEECLNLSVWAPASGGPGLPVMVWIHGGAFINGSSAIPVYDGSTFARDGVVLVAINYRLGAEGFLHLPDATPNRGMLDQVAALRWVQDNIAAFGGDPGHVTVFGESAGAMSVGTLLAMPAAQGLFRRAVLQSGACHHVLTAATASKVAGYVGEQLGVPVGLAEMAGIAPERFVEAQRALSAQAATQPDPARWGEITANAMIFEPVVDGEVLPQRPIDAVAAGASADVDILVGANRDEHRLFLAPVGGIDNVTDPVLAAITAAYRLPADAVDRYRSVRAGSAGDVLADVMSDWFFRIPAIRLAEAHPRTHVYEFDWTSPALGGQLGSCHALEIGFVFDTLPASAALVGDAAPRELADAMHRAWVAFATTGDPGWEVYGPQRRVRRFGDVVETVADPRGELRALWTGIR